MIALFKRLFKSREEDLLDVLGQAEKVLLEVNHWQFTGQLYPLMHERVVDVIMKIKAVKGE